MAVQSREMLTSFDLAIRQEMSLSTISEGINPPIYADNGVDKINLPVCFTDGGSVIRSGSTHRHCQYALELQNSHASHGCTPKLCGCDGRSNGQSSIDKINRQSIRSMTQGHTMTYDPHSSLFTAGPSRYGPCSHMISVSLLLTGGQRLCPFQLSIQLATTPLLPSPISPPTSPQACPARISSPSGGSFTKYDALERLEQSVRLNFAIEAIRPKVFRCECGSTGARSKADLDDQIIIRPPPDIDSSKTSHAFPQTIQSSV